MGLELVFEGDGMMVMVWKDVVTGGMVMEIASVFFYSV